MLILNSAKNTFYYGKLKDKVGSSFEKLDKKTPF